MMNHQTFAPLLFLTILFCEAPASAEVRLAKMLGSHMVVQRDKPIRVWGFAAPSEVVTVSVAAEKKSASADTSGAWLVELSPRTWSTDAKPLTITVTGSATPTPVQIEDVLVGDVWLCAGQSNMGIAVQDAQGGKEALAEANFPNIRLFDRVPYSLAAEPRDDLVGGSWRPCTPQHTAIFSAVGYYFARQAHQQTGVPLGMISCSFGGTAIETWISKAALEQVPTAGPLLQRYQDALPGYDARYAAYRKLFDAMVDARNKARARGEEWWKIPEPGQPFGPHHRYAPFVVYNDMIHPLRNVTLRGVLWYQGESSADRGELHCDLLPALVRDWRRNFRHETLPFGIVQLPNINPRKPEPADSEWAELREAQFLTARNVPYTGLAVTIDIGDANDLHPANKRGVGERLAQWALGTVYEKDVVSSGPLFREHAVEGNTIRLRFDRTAGGLVSQGDGPLTGFAIAGEDRKFVWVDAAIDGETVVVRSSTVTAPVAVRYAWADNPAGNLANRGGLLASPFRTDKWPGISTGKR